MSEYEIKERYRGRTLIIVEGFHEKDELFSAIMDAFPALKHQNSQVWIYGTNIFMLHKMIEDTYGEQWIDEDVDLPYVISKSDASIEGISYKRDFINIYLFFDYERHDPNFSEKKILAMQSFFSDVTDMGQLYINYPMVESYMDFTGLPDEGFIYRKYPIEQNGKNYKNLIRHRFLNDLVGIKSRIRDILTERFPEVIHEYIENVVEDILMVDRSGISPEAIFNVLAKYTKDNNDLEYTSHLIARKLQSLRNWTEGNYYFYLHKIFVEIIKHMANKAYFLSTDSSLVCDMNSELEQIDYGQILKKQNEVSTISNSVYVLNESVLLVIDYNKNLVYDSVTVQET